MIEATSCGGVVIHRGKILLCINLTGTVMRAGYCRKEQWNQAKRMNRQHCGK